MDCTRMVALIPDYSANALTARERGEVEDHLAACEPCRREVRRLEQVLALAEQYGALEPPAGMWNAIAARLTREPSRSGFHAFVDWLLGRRLRTAWAGAATIAAVAGLWLALRSGPVPPTGPNVPADFAIRAMIRQHALSSADSPLADRVAWEAVAELSAPPAPSQIRPAPPGVNAPSRPSNRVRGIR
ncbi:MAG: zf-HC2 domain-containing protein [Armatimonadetes bacterium]|nr:zf-HC2 domain-containing protein [Armatimonadota bacterium]